MKKSGSMTVARRRTAANEPATNAANLPTMSINISRIATETHLMMIASFSLGN